MATLFTTILYKILHILSDHFSIEYTTRMATLFTSILYKILYILSYTLLYFILFVIFVISLSILRCCCRRKKKLSFESNKKDWVLLRSLQEDVDNVLKSGSQMNNEANELWPPEEHQGMTAQLQKSVTDWYKKSIEDLPNSAEFNERKKLEQMVDDAKNIQQNLDKLKDKIRFLQVRPIDDERQALVQKEDKKFVEDLIAVVQKVDNLIPEVKKEDKLIADLIADVQEKDEPFAGNSDLPGDVKVEIQSFTLHWAPFRAFLTDLQSSGLETKTEKAWLEEAKEIVDKAHPAIDNFVKNTRKWKGILPCLSSNRKARTKLEEEMKRINTGFSKFLDRKERFGIQFKRYPTRRKIYPLQSKSGTSQEQASNDVQISENGSRNFSNELEDLKNNYKNSLEKKSLERLQTLCTKFTEVHGEAAEKGEGIRSSTEERLKQINKLTEKTVYYLKNYKKNSSGLSWICKCWRKPVKKLDEKFDQIECALEIIEQTTKAYKFEIRKEMGAVGLDEDIQAVASQLITGNKHVVCVVGMKGIGKTTLTKNVYGHSDIVDHFPALAWVTLTDQKAIDYDAVCKDVAKQLSEPDINGSQEEENRRGEWKNKVCAILKKKKYLVVLDDFTAEIDWETLKAAFPETGGSRILLTTRDQWVVRKVCGKLHCLRLRTKEESWRLFTKMMGDGFGSESVKKLAEETVGRCGGWPRQILHLGYLMSPKDDDKLQKWPESITPAQEPWLKYLKIEGRIEFKKWLESHKIEIKDWPDHEGKKDFLVNLSKVFAFFFNLFPRDYEIPARRLVALSVAEGLEFSKVFAMDYLSVLIDLNLIQAVEFLRGKVKTCRLPHALKEQLSFGSENLQYHLVDLLDKNSEINNDIHGKGTNSPKFQQSYKNLISFLSFDTREGNRPGQDVGKFLRKGIASGCFHSLKVLDLERVFRPQLPNNIGKLDQLMYLGLRGTYMEEIPLSIGNLLNLQTLDVKYTYVRTLPKSIWKLQKLQHLYLNESHRSKFVPQTKSTSLKNLKTLWGLFLDDFNAIKNGLNMLNNLTKLGLTFQLGVRQQEKLACWVEGLEYLKSLRLRSVDENGDAQDLHLGKLSGLKNLSSLYLFGKLETQSIKNLCAGTSSSHLSDLTLSASGLKDDPMQILGSLSGLKSLCFYSDSYEGKQMLFIEKSFSQLQVLRLWNLKKLERLKGEEEAMQKLRELEIRGCKNLKVFNGLEHLTSLQELKLPNMNKNFISQMKEDKSQFFGGDGYPPTIMDDHWQPKLIMSET